MDMKVICTMGGPPLILNAHGGGWVAEGLHCLHNLTCFYTGPDENDVAVIKSVQA